MDSTQAARKAGTNGTVAGPEAGTAWYTVLEAAERLGIKERAVRKRIASGRLSAKYTAQGWRVLLPSAPGLAPEPAPTAPTVPRAGPVPAPTALHDELVDQHRAEVAFLRSELQEQRHRHAAEIAAWQERLREAHLLAAQRPALGPVPSHQADSAVQPTAPPAPWWRRLLAWWP